MNSKKEKAKSGCDTGLQNANRRKVVKTIVGGMATVTSFNVLPVKWGAPIIESIVLPAHAATSGICSAANMVGTWTFTLVQITGPSPGDSITKTLTLKSDGSTSGYFTDNPDDGITTGTWSSSDGDITIDLAIQFPEDGTDTAKMTGTIGTDCDTFSGNVLYIQDGGGRITGTFSATRA